MSQGRLPEKCAECGQLINYDNDQPLVEGGLILRPGFLTAEWDGQSVKLTDSEFRTLVCIVRRGAGHLLARKMAIYTEVFEKPDGTPEPKIVDVVVCKVRKKLDTIGAGGLIATVWGQGYRFDRTNGSMPVPTGQMRRNAAK